MLNHLTPPKRHDAPRTSLDLLTHGDPDSLEGQYQSFILNARLDRSEATAKDYSYKLRYFLSFCASLGIHRPADVTSDHVKAYLFHLKETLRPTSQKDLCKVVRCFFNWLFDEGRIKENPMARVKTPRAPEVIIKIYTPEHIRKILLLCDDGTRTGIRNKAMVLVLLDTGMRRKELANIQVTDVDIQTGNIIVMGKGNRERVVRVSKPTLKAVIRYYEMRPGNHPQLWLTEEGKPLTIEGVSMIFRVLKKRAGFTDVRLSAHTFRHTCATMSIRNKGNIFHVQSLLGHATMEMTRHYSKLIDSEEAVKEHDKFSPVKSILHETLEGGKYARNR